MSTTDRFLPRFALLAAALCAAAPLAAEEGVTLSGLRGVKLVDAGIFTVSGAPATARDETFEFLQRADGGYTLLSATTMANGAFRVQARYDYDARWNAVAGFGQAIYGEEPVRVELKAVPGGVAIRARGAQTAIEKTIPCPKGCFMDMAPSGAPMFVMTRHYDRARRGEQSFQWAAQELSKPETSPDDQQAAIDLRRELPVKRADGSTVVIREYAQVERIPTPRGMFVMEFDIWTDDAERPMGYRINKVAGRPPAQPILAWRRGYEDLRAQVIGAAR